MIAEAKHVLIESLPTVILVGIVFILLKLYLRRSFWSSLGIAEVRGLPLFGNLLPEILHKKTHFQIVSDIYNANPGLPYVGMYHLTRPVLLIKDAALLEKMLKEDASNFEDHGFVADTSDPLTLNLLYLKGHLWKWTRSKLRTTFSTPSLKMLYTGIQRITDDFLDEYEGNLNVRPAMDKFACDVIAKVVFCLDDSTGFVETTHKVYSTKGLSGLRVFLRLFCPRLSLALGVKLVPQSIENFYRNAIKRSVREPGSFFDLMMQLKETEPDFTEDLMLAQFFIFIFAGFETTATALTFSLYLLAKHPEVQEKARKEVDDVTSKSGVSFEAIKDMIYLEYIINEALRMYTPVTGITRISENDYKLPCGKVLPKGTDILLPYLEIHKDPKYFDDPLTFKPERWENPSKAFFPFGTGPRNCLGMKFALLEMKIFLSSLLLKYIITINPKTPDPLIFDTGTFFIVPKIPIKINIKQRDFHQGI